jgi:hypothetical protein
MPARRWRSRGTIVAIVALALVITKIAAFAVLGRSSPGEVAAMLAAENGKSVSRVNCSHAHLASHAWEALYTTWAKYRYTCPETLGHGTVDVFTVWVRHGEITDVAGGL